jgi:very-short-patch-repair endonuclease
VGPHILDFYCGEARYNLELDGSQHGFPEAQAKDEARDAYLKSRNIQTRRFWNSQLKDIRFVRETIWTDLQQRAPHVGNQKPEKPTRLPTRSKKLNALQRSHPSP